MAKIRAVPPAESDLGQPPGNPLQEPDGEVTTTLRNRRIIAGCGTLFPAFPTASSMRFITPSVVGVFGGFHVPNYCGYFVDHA
jgi:hypothetical protein